MREEALLFGQRRTLVGVITWPDATQRPLSLPAVLLLNAGILQHVGPNRTYVRLARSLAACGFVALRFDFSGIGDSLPRQDTVPFDQACIQEAQEAMALLETAAGSTRFVLMGLCSGARISLQMALRDGRVAGAVLINPNAHLHDTADEALSATLRSRALQRHFVRIALFSSFRAKNWRKALSGDFNLSLLGQAVRGLRLPRPGTGSQRATEAAPQANAQFETLSARGVRVLHVFSEGDEGLDYFRMMLGKGADAWPMELIRGANHTFTPLWSQERLVQVIVEWARGFS